MENGERLISVIMPAYNSESYISDSIRSVLNQTWTEWELIIIDDGSTDRTAEIVRGYMEQSGKIKYVKNENNIGVARSRNKGIRLARGGWIAFLDSDDCWRKDKLEKQVKLSKESGARFLFTGSAFINEEGQLSPYVLSVPSHVTYRRLLKQNVISCSSVLIRKELLLLCPMQDGERIHEDFAVWLTVLRDHEKQAEGLNEPLLIYRVSKKSKSGDKLQAALMTYRVYRMIGLSRAAACYYWLWYAVRSIRKYKRIYGREPVA